VRDVSEDMHHNLQRSLRIAFKKKNEKHMLYIFAQKYLFNLNSNLEEQINFITTYDSRKGSLAQTVANITMYNTYMHYSCFTQEMSIP